MLTISKTLPRSNKKYMYLLPIKKEVEYNYFSLNEDHQWMNQSINEWMNEWMNDSINQSLHINFVYLLPSPLRVPSCPYTCLSISPSIHLIYQSIHLSIYPSIYLPTTQCVCLHHLYSTNQWSLIDYCLISVEIGSRLTWVLFFLSNC